MPSSFSVSGPGLRLTPPDHLALPDPVLSISTLPVVLVSPGVILQGILAMVNTVKLLLEYDTQLAVHDQFLKAGSKLAALAAHMNEDSCLP